MTIGFLVGAVLNKQETQVVNKVIYLVMDVLQTTANKLFIQLWMFRKPHPPNAWLSPHNSRIKSDSL